MDNNFSIGFGTEDMPFFQEILPQFCIVLNDAIVNERNSAAAIGVRMGIEIIGHAMSRPSRMTNADIPVKR